MRQEHAVWRFGRYRTLQSDVTPALGATLVVSFLALISMGHCTCTK